MGTFEGRVRTSGNEVTDEGSWKYTGGTGMYKGITGGGTYRSRMTSPTTVESNWQGNYELAARTKVA
jgi:hypothetical protein